MKKHSLKIIFILSLLFNIAFMGAFGYRWYIKQNKPRSHHLHRSKDRRSLKERLNLTDEQYKQLRELRLRLSDKIYPIRKELMNERCQLTELLMAETYDSSAIEKQLNRISTLQNDLEKEVVYQLMEEKTVLTPEQKKHFIRLISKQFQEGGPPHRFLQKKGDHKRTKRHAKNIEQTTKEDSSCVSE